MDDRAFDRAMRMLAARERPPEAGARLAQVLSSLPDAPAPVSYTHLTLPTNREV